MDEAPLGDINPDESPTSDARRVRTDSATAKRTIGRDLLFVVISALCWVIVAGAGAICVRTYIVPPGSYSPQMLPVLYWLRCVGLIAGRLPGDFISGFLLGRFLRRINPWRVFVAFAVYLGAVGSITLVFRSAEAELYFSTLGVSGALLQTILKIVVNLAVVAAGIRFGRARLRKTATD